MNGWKSTETLATELGIKPRTLQAWCRDGKVPHHRLGRLIRFSPQDVELIKQTAQRHSSARLDSVNTPNPHYRNRAELVPFPVRAI